MSKILCNVDKKEKILMHFFRTAKYFYAYDGGSNEIIRMDKSTWATTRDILEGCHYKSDIKTYENNGSNIQRNIIKKLFAEKVFSSTKISKLKLCNYNKILYQLRNKLDVLCLKITENCNLRCDYCIYSDKYPTGPSYSTRNMLAKIAKAAINLYKDRCSGNDSPCISFYGGEPLLNFKLIKQCVEYSKKTFERSVEFAITTNGTLLSKDKIRFLIKNNFILQVSVDGPKEVHNKHRRTRDGKPSFDRIYSSLRKIFEENKDYYYNRVGFNCVLSPPYPLSVVESFFSSDKLFRKNKVAVNFLRPFDTNINLLLKGSEQQKYNTEYTKIKKCYINALRKKRQGDIRIGKALFERTLQIIHNREMTKLGCICHPNGICIPGTRKLYVEVVGDIYMCEKVEPFFKLGNVLSGFDENKSRKLIDEYCELSTQNCSHCWVIRLCGLCFVQSIKNNNLDIERKTKICKSTRKFLSTCLEIYASVLEENPTALDYLEQRSTSN